MVEIIFKQNDKVTCTTTDHNKKPAKFQKDSRKTVGEVAHIRYLLLSEVEPRKADHYAPSLFSGSVVLSIFFFEQIAVWKIQFILVNFVSGVFKERNRQKRFAIKF